MSYFFTLSHSFLIGQSEQSEHSLLPLLLELNRLITLYTIYTKVSASIRDTIMSWFILFM